MQHFPLLLLLLLLVLLFPFPFHDLLLALVPVLVVGVLLVLRTPAILLHVLLQPYRWDPQAALPKAFLLHLLLLPVAALRASPDVKDSCAPLVLPQPSVGAPAGAHKGTWGARDK
jgi:hypothetical protein